MDKRELHRHKEEIDNQFYQQGLSLGTKAGDPLALITENTALQLSENRENFIRGFVKGINEFKSKMDLSDTSPFVVQKVIDNDLLHFYSFGLARKKINGPIALLGDEFDINSPDFSGSNGIVTAEEVDKIFNLSGYVSGFIIGLARDYGLVRDYSRIPINSNQYETFAIGVGGGSFELTPKPYLNYVFESDRNLIEQKYKTIYKTGTLVRFCEEVRRVRK